MRLLNGEIFLSATDLMRFVGCRHATRLDLRLLRGETLTPRDDTEDAQLLQKQGDAHEAAHLQHLKETGRTVVEMTRGALAEDARATREVLAGGPDVVFQGALAGNRWGGWSDFLERVERPSALGAFSYEVTDTKLKRKPHPKHVLQLVLYSDMLATIQGLEPEHAHVQLGNGERATLRLADYRDYARQARARLEDFIDQPAETRPLPCDSCSLCRWEDVCKAQWKAEDSLFSVANISRLQVKRLEAAGIRTMEALAAAREPVRRIAAETFSRLKAQARLQHARKQGEPAYELRPLQAGKGFALLPPASPGDLFYDIEGDPHVEGGLEYLHGIWFDQQFRAFWAHDHAEEAVALSQLFAFFQDRLQRFPDAHIYHYAPYEITALRRLSAKYGIGEAFLDSLLRERRFVDLFAVVRGGLIASEKNYSIKSLEVF